MSGQQYDVALFRSLWDQGVTTEDMAKVFDVQPSAVTRRAKRLDLTPRIRTGIRDRKTLAAQAAVRASDVAKPRRAPALEPRGPFTPERDQLIFDSKGTYAALAELADQWGASLTAIQQRYHMLRK